MKKIMKQFSLLILLLLLLISCRQEQGVIEDKNVTVLSGSSIIGAIRWSGDGKYGVYDENGRVWLLDLTKPIGEDNPYLLTGTASLALTPSWSPDSKNVIFAYKKDRQNRKEPTNIWMLNLNRKELRQLTFFTKDVREPEWLPGDTLIFKDASYRLYSMKIKK